MYKITHRYHGTSGWPCGGILRTKSLARAKRIVANLRSKSWTIEVTLETE